MSTHVIILAGGMGTRFWPLSRVKRPKQFLSMFPGGESLIQTTFRRSRSLVDGGSSWVVTTEGQESLVREHLPEAVVVTEPAPRNTAASIGLAAAFISQVDPDGVMVVLPADHSVREEKKLRDTLMQAVALAQDHSYLVTIGIPPSAPNTAYGYILQGKEIESRIFTVARFFEKPSFERAVSYFESGRYLWNSGMFVWKVSTFLDSLKEHMPQLFDGLLQIREVVGTPRERPVLEEVFQSLDSVSIDFGVLEHARNCAVVSSVPLGWNDVGSWDAWAEHFECDSRGNLNRGDTLFIDSNDCVSLSEHRTIALVGVDGVVVIDSGDALLIVRRDKVQDVKKVVQELKRLGRADLI